MFALIFVNFKHYWLHTVTLNIKISVGLHIIEYNIQKIKQRTEKMLEQIKTDDNGYLKNWQDWSVELVPELALQESIELTQAHWDVILFVRDFYLEYKTSPAIRALVKALEKKFGPEKSNSRYLYKLFPEGPAKQATKLAGLPKPVKCI